MADANKISHKTIALRYSLGVCITGRVCAADEAFNRLGREVNLLDSSDMWQWFADRFRELEAALTAVGGFDESLADAIEGPGGYFGATETLNQHLKAEDICFELEGLLGAFFVVIQPKMNAVTIAADHIYDAAKTGDSVTVSKSSRAWPTAFDTIWQIANYVKHNDEWGRELDKRQQRCFDVLERLGVARIADGQRQLDRWPLISAACAFSNESTLASAVDVIVSRCKCSCQEIQDSIQADFAAFSHALNDVRKRNSQKLQIRTCAGEVELP